MRDRSESLGAGADGAGPGEKPAGRSGRRRRLALLAAAGLVSAGLVAACSSLQPSAPGESAHPTGPRADSSAPSTAALSTVDSPVANPAPLPDRPLGRAAFLYARCNPMDVEDEKCRLRLVLTDGSQYTLPKGVMHEGPGPISPDGTFLLLYDESDGLVLRDLASGTSRTVAPPDPLTAWWGSVFWSPGARWAAVSLDGLPGEKGVAVVVDIANARRVEDSAPSLGAQLVAVSAHGDPIWAKPADTSATTVHWIVGGRQPRVVDADLRSHLRPGEIVNPTGWPGELMLGDGITAAVPIIRAGDDPPGWADGDAILLVDLTTGVVRHRLDLPTNPARVRLHSSGCGLGPNALVEFEGGDPTSGQRPTDPTDPTDMVALDSRTGARGSGYRLRPEGFPLLFC
jgi:hypothetical protein